MLIKWIKIIRYFYWLLSNCCPNYSSKYSSITNEKGVNLEIEADDYSELGISCDKISTILGVIP